MSIIRIKNMVFYGYHGVKTEENSLGARFEVDIKLHADLNKAIATDKLDYTVNYNDVYQLVEKTVTTRKYYLIEALAGEIGQQLLDQFPSLQQVTVCVRKPNAPIKGVLDYVEVEIEKRRNQNEFR